MPDNTQERAQIRYSQQLNANQNAALARKNETFRRQQARWTAPTVTRPAIPSPFPGPGGVVLTETGAGVVFVVLALRRR